MANLRLRIVTRARVSENNRADLFLFMNSDHPSDYFSSLKFELHVICRKMFWAGVVNLYPEISSFINP